MGPTSDVSDELKAGRGTEESTVRLAGAIITSDLSECSMTLACASLKAPSIEPSE